MHFSNLLFSFFLFCFYSLCLGTVLSDLSSHIIWDCFHSCCRFLSFFCDGGGGVSCRLTLAARMGLLFKPYSKLRALKSCTHEREREPEREREGTSERDRYLVGMRVFQFSRCCSSSLKSAKSLHD